MRASFWVIGPLLGRTLAGTGDKQADAKRAVLGGIAGVALLVGPIALANSTGSPASRSASRARSGASW